MKLDTNDRGELTLEATGEDGAATITLKDGNVVTFEERAGKLYRDGEPLPLNRKKELTRRMP